MTKKIARLSEPIERWDRLTASLTDIAELVEMLDTESDKDELDELSDDVGKIEREITDWEFLCKMNGRDDVRNAIIEIHSGAGGTESTDWAEMLMRMYLRYIERMNFTSNVIDIQSGEQTGIKSVTIEVEGEYAFGYLRSELGVHRLVRISPFDATSRRHTSFASLFVYPETEAADEIVLNPTELRIDTFRASGAGGQHVNKTDSAIRITHLPTGTVSTCQSERSQLRNRDSAMKFLKAKLLKLQREEEMAKRDVVEANKMKNEWGSQIRSYVLHPYRMVKDHRTNTETGNTDAVLDGDLRMFVEAYLMDKAGDKK